MHPSISIENNVFLMSMLLYEELITKRRDKLKACKKDWKSLRFMMSLKVSWNISKCEISNEQLISLVEIEEAKGKGHNDILTWLEQFISESSDKFA